jgi:hypothetical protein
LKSTEIGLEKTGTASGAGFFCVRSQVRGAMQSAATHPYLEPPQLYVAVRTILGFAQSSERRNIKCGF